MKRSYWFKLHSYSTETYISIETFVEVLTCFYVSIIDYDAFNSNFRQYLEYFLVLKNLLFTFLRLNFKVPENWSLFIIRKSLVSRTRTGIIKERLFWGGSTTRCERHYFCFPYLSSFHETILWKTGFNISLPQVTKESTLRNCVVHPPLPSSMETSFL